MTLYRKTLGRLGGVWLLFIVWIVGWFLTFGWEYNRYGECETHVCHFDRAMSSVFKGWAWPIYWTGRAAIEVTKP